MIRKRRIIENAISFVDSPTITANFSYHGLPFNNNVEKYPQAIC